MLKDARLVTKIIAGNEEHHSQIERVRSREVPLLIVVSGSKAGPDTEGKILYTKRDLGRVGSVVTGLVDAVVYFSACPAG
jgi:hypothetical protein